MQVTVVLIVCRKGGQEERTEKGNMGWSFLCHRRFVYESNEECLFLSSMRYLSLQMSSIVPRGLRAERIDSHHFIVGCCKLPVRYSSPTLM